MRASLLAAALAAALATPLAAQRAATPAAAALAKLDVAVGHWQFRGTIYPAAGAAHMPAKAGVFTWDEHCRWSANHFFLECAFSNTWSGRRIESLVVDTYNSRERRYWHYEIFVAGSGARPFIAPMTIAGDTWVEIAGHERIVYRFTSPTRVMVKIESTADGGKTWRTLDQGAGHKLSD